MKKYIKLGFAEENCMYNPGIVSFVSLVMSKGWLMTEFQKGLLQMKGKISNESPRNHWMDQSKLNKINNKIAGLELIREPCW